MTNEEYIKAIDMRRSRRAYSSKPLDDNTKNIIRAMVDAVNGAADLDFIFIDDATPAFRIFTGKFSMIAVCGPDSQKTREDCGYYGESVVLQCVYHGLATCWVSGTYNENKVYDMIDLPRNKRLFCVITIGNPKNRFTTVERTMYAATHNKNKTYQDMFDYSDAKLPEPYVYGMKLVEKAPSAVNRRPVKFRYENGVLSGSVEDPYSDKSIDFGIAKLHFVLGCRAKGVIGHWSFENVFETEEAKVIKLPVEPEEEE
ncbi:MAG: nitroreductase family protein [Eubacterium sp.]|nr:nitroreductase family protein [Eubacterium sp.]